MRILAIETSCDETAIALVEASGPSTSSGLAASLPKFKVIKSLVTSQIPIHRPFGGVVPNLAKREHLKNLPILWQRIMNQELGIKKREKKTIIHNSRFVIPNIDLIAVTVGPGLEPALWTGIEFAKKLSADLKKPLIGANHLEGHLYSFLLAKSYSNVLKNIRIRNLFPAVALIVSGGHTILLLVHDLAHWKKLGETQDDAVGEAFDKVARLLELPYPGGPEIERLAKSSKLEAKSYIPFPRPMLNQKNYNFSFSGLKTAVLYYLRDHGLLRIRKYESEIIKPHDEKTIIHDSKFMIQDIAASFQQAAIDVLVQKTMRAAREHGARSILLSGGVAANALLRKTLKAESQKLKAHFLVADLKYNTDNAVMIAVAAYMTHLRKKKYKLEAQGGLNI